jgi:DNA-binding SARP family transcriptional activator
MDVRLLGPVEVVVDGGALPLGGPRQRTLLALLALRRGEVVAADRLIGELWPDCRPASGVTALQNAVARLRRVLGADRLETRSRGYALRLEAGELDLERFDDLVTQAAGRDAAARSALLGEALLLWHGAPLRGLADVPFVATEADRLEELRLVALDARIDADLERGRHAALVAELAALHASHPWRENTARQLMLALYRCDRQAEALDVYRETRRLQAEDFGREPSASLRQLERAVLQHDATLELPASIFEVGSPDDEPRPERRISARALVVIAAAAVAAASGLAATTRSGDRADSLTVPAGWSVVGDGFDGPSPDHSIWSQTKVGSGLSETVRDGHLEIRLAADATPGGPDESIGGSLRTRCSFAGDFTAQVRFRLLHWPPSNGVGIALWAVPAGNPPALVMRNSTPDAGEFYSSLAAGESKSTQLLRDRAGTLRLARSKGAITASYWRRHAWHSFLIGGLAAPVTIAIGAISGGPGQPSAFAHRLVVAEFDDFAVAGKRPLCPAGARAPVA